MRDTHRTGSCGAKPDDVSLVRPKLRRDFVDASLAGRVKVACRRSRAYADEARRIAANIAKLPEHLGRS